MEVRPLWSPEAERLFQRSSGRLSGQAVVEAVERRYVFGAPGWFLMTLPSPDGLTARKLSDDRSRGRALARDTRAVRVQRTGPRAARDRVRWSEELSRVNFNVSSIRIMVLSNGLF